MSDTPPSNSHPEIPKPLLSEENLPTGTIAWVGFGSLALFAAGIYCAYLLMTNRTVEALVTGEPATPSEIGKPEIGIVDQQLFELEHRQKDERREQDQRLNSYGWVDKQKQAVHIPIEEAMRQVLAEQKK